MTAGIRTLSKLAAVLCGLALALPACVTSDVDGPPGTLGTNAGVGEIELRNVYVVPPQDSQYQPGQRARVRLTLLNDGSRTDALTKVTSGVASATSLHWDRACDGEAETVDRITIRAHGLVPQDPVPTGRQQPVRSPTRQDTLHQPYYIQITADEALRRGTTVPISFTFEHAGTVTLDVIVQSNHPQTERAQLACLTST